MASTYSCDFVLTFLHPLAFSSKDSLTFAFAKKQWTFKELKVFIMSFLCSQSPASTFPTGANPSKTGSKSNNWLSHLSL